MTTFPQQQQTFLPRLGKWVDIYEPSHHFIDSSSRSWWSRLTTESLRCPRLTDLGRPIASGRIEIPTHFFLRAWGRCGLLSERPTTAYFGVGGLFRRSKLLQPWRGGRRKVVGAALVDPELRFSTTPSFPRVLQSPPQLGSFCPLAPGEGPVRSLGLLPRWFVRLGIFATMEL